MTDKQEGEPKEPKKIRRKPKKKDDRDQLTKLIQQALVVRIAQEKNRKENVDELNALLVTCQEFMKSFVILGYDLDGQPIQPLIHVSTQQEADAIGSYLSRFINSNMRFIEPSLE